MNLEQQEQFLPLAADYFSVIERLESKLNDNFQENAGSTVAENDRRKMEILLHMREHLGFRSKAASQCVQNPSVGLAGMLQDRRSLIDGVAKLLSGLWDILNIQIWSSHIRHVESKYGSGFGSYFRFHRSMIKLNALIFMPLVAFVILPQALHGESIYADEFHPNDILNGTWNISLIYYGSYVPFDWNAFHYNEAYFGTAFVIYLSILINITVKMARQYSQNFIQAKASKPFEFCYQIFAGWDFAIGAKYAKSKHASVRTQLKILMDKVETMKADPTGSKWPLIIGGLTWLWALGVIAGMGFLTNWIFRSSTLDIFTKSTIVIGIVFLVPQVFKLLDTIIAILDDSSQFTSAARLRSRMYQEFIKIVCLELAVLIATLYYYNSDNTSSTCTEDLIGQEVYRLLLLYFIIFVVGHFTLESFYKLMVSSFMKSLPSPEFDVAFNTMHLLFAQTLAWVAIYYSPVLILFFLVILFITFYFKLASLKLNCSGAAGAKQPWQAAQSQTLFFSMTFANFLVVFIHFLFIINKKPSEDCGPFKNLKTPSDLISNVIILQPGFAGLILATAVVVLHYLVTQRAARRSRARLLKDRLQKTRTENEQLQWGIFKARRLRMLVLSSRQQDDRE